MVEFKRLPFVHTLRYDGQFLLVSFADDHDIRDMIDTSYLRMPPLQTFVFVVYRVTGLDGWLVFVEMSVLLRDELKLDSIKQLTQSLLPPNGCSDSADCFVPHVTPCWVFVVSLAVRCTCSVWLAVPTRRKNATPTHRAIIECHKLDMSCDLLLTLHQHVLVFSDQSLVERNNKKMLHIN
jgi:hypothetical protein